MSYTPRRYSIEEYEQMIRKNGNKTFRSEWSLFDFVYGGKKAELIRAKFQQAYPENYAEEIAAEETKIQQAINNRVERGWLQCVKNDDEA